jgi:hypothetical protein
MAIKDILPQYKRCKRLYLFFLIIGGIIVGYWLLMNLIFPTFLVQEKDFMNTKIIDFPYLENCCSWWPISHFILFFFIGIIFPQCGPLAMTAGILWEFFEIGMNVATKGPHQVMKNKDGSYEYTQNWWAASFKDILFNFAGFYLGKFVIC